MFYLFNGDNWEIHKNIEEAKKSAIYQIDIARDCCDPEWPDWVNHIAIYTNVTEIEHADEDGDCLFIAKETNHIYDDTMGCDYFCEYDLLPYVNPNP